MGDVSGVMGFILPNHLTIILPYPIPGPYLQARAGPSRPWLACRVQAVRPVDNGVSPRLQTVTKRFPFPSPIVYDGSVGGVPT